MGMMINRRRVMGGKSLPYDAEIEYLQSSGTQYIDTGVKASATLYKVEVLFRKVGTMATILGNQTGDALIYVNSVGDFSVFSSNVQKVVLHLGNDNKIVVLKYDGTEVTITGDYTAAFTTVWEPLNYIELYANNYKNTHTDKGSVRISYAKFWNNGVLIRDFIPVRVGQVGYMYDKVSGQLFGNAGTGSFILGPDKGTAVTITQQQQHEMYG